MHCMRIDMLHVLWPEQFVWYSLCRLLFYGTNEIYKVKLDGSGHTKIALSESRYTYSIAINYKKKRICWVEIGMIRDNIAIDGA